ncbi:MAG: EAL domain-containing protein [Pseudomonadota bacterium]
MKRNFNQIWIFALGCALSLVPVLASNWMLGQLVNQSMDRTLQAEVSVAADGLGSELMALTEELVQLRDASATSCVPRLLDSFRSLTLRSPTVSAVMTLDASGQVLCSSPTITSSEFVLTRDSENLFGGQVQLGSAQLAGGWLNGFILSIRDDDVRHAVFIPRRMLSHLLRGVDGQMGVAVTLGDLVMFARDPQALEGSDRLDLHVASTTLAGGAIRVQVTIDRNLLASDYAAIKMAGMIAALLVGALVVFILTKLIHYTPNRVNEIERAITRNEFVPFYQPVIDIENGKVVGCEVLVRWIKPDGTVVSPGAFIGLAEQTGLAIPMTRNLMERVVADLQKEYAKHPGLKVAINLFNQHFASLDIIEDVESIFGPSSITYNQVVLEITERAPLESLSQAKVIMRRLQRIGCRLALDDAGTGHGGLAYLQELGLDIVKIDKMFIDQLGQSRIGESITHTLSDLAHQLDMDVVAEGVESVEQVAHLKRYGIRQAQGYLFAPALKAEQYLALVRKLGVAPNPRSSQWHEEEENAAKVRSATQDEESAVGDETADAA